MANALPLLLVGAGALLLMSGKKKKKASGVTAGQYVPGMHHEIPSAGPAVECPSLIKIRSDKLELTEHGLHEGGSRWILKKALRMVTSGNKDIVAMVESSLMSQISPQCLRDPNVKVEVTKLDGTTTTTAAPNVFYAMANDLIDDLIATKYFDDFDVNRAENAIELWWEQNAGELPKPGFENA